MKKNVAVSGLTLSHVLGSPITGGLFSVVSIPSNTTKESNKGIFVSPLLYSFSGGNSPGFVPGSVGTLVPQFIISTALKTKDFSLLVIRQDDSGIMACQGTLEVGGQSPIAGGVEISDSNQDKVKAE